MNAFTKKFDFENFHTKIEKLKPDYIIMGREAGEELNSRLTPYIVIPISEGYSGHYRGIPVYIFSTFPEDKIIFGLE